MTPVPCQWQPVKGAQVVDRTCDAPTHLMVVRTDDTDLPLCPAHLRDYVANYGAQEVTLA